MLPTWILLLERTRQKKVFVSRHHQQTTATGCHQPTGSSTAQTKGSDVRNENKNDLVLRALSWFMILMIFIVCATCTVTMRHGWPTDCDDKENTR